MLESPCTDVCRFEGRTGYWIWLSADAGAGSRWRHLPTTSATRPSVNGHGGKPSSAADWIPTIETQPAYQFRSSRVWGLCVIRPAQGASGRFAAVISTTSMTAPLRDPPRSLPLLCRAVPSERAMPRRRACEWTALGPWA